MSDTIIISDEEILEALRTGFFFPPVEEAEPGWIKHVVCEGARFHVLHWTTEGEHCSEPNCIVNKRHDVAPNAVGVKRESGLKVKAAVKPSPAS